MTNRSLDIVLVLPDPPLPFGNAAARWFYVLVKGLVARGHTTTTYAVYRQEAELRACREEFRAGEFDLRLYAETPNPGWKSKWIALRRPYSYPFSSALIRDLEARLCDGFDVLHLEQVWSGWLGWRHAHSAILNVHYLFDIDLAGVAPRSLKERLLHVASVRAERRILRHYPHVNTLTERLSEHVRALAPKTTVRTVPLGLDLSRYSYDESSYSRDGSSESRGNGFDGFVHISNSHDDSGSREPVVALIGSFNWHPSYMSGKRLLSDLWPEIRKRVPNARLHLVGRHAAEAFGSYASADGISIHGDVPDIVPYFRGADVMVYAPENASGMKIKVLEAFALGLPVVTTPAGVEGIPAVDGVHAGIAEDNRGLIDRTVNILENNEERLEMRRRARRLLVEHLSPDTCLDKLEESYMLLLEHGRRHSSEY